MALGLSSLILSLLAIFQSINSGSALSRSISSVEAAALRAEGAASRVVSASNELVRHTTDIPLALGAMAKEFAETKEAFKNLNATTSVDEKGQKSASTQWFDKVSLTLGGMLALYIASKAKDKSVDFDCEEVIDNDWGSYAQGYLAAVANSGVLEITLAEGRFKTTSLPHTTEEWKALIDRNSSIDLREQSRVVDKYFSALRARKKPARGGLTK